MLETLLGKYALEVIFGLISAGALWFCKCLWAKNKELEKLQKEEENRKYRQMIVDEIDPIIADLHQAEEDIKKIKAQGAQTIAGIESVEKANHDEMYADLKKIQEENERRFALILNSYKFRLIQLCKYHLKDGYISTEDFEQVSEMYALYKSMGGNGQAEEYFKKVTALDNQKSE